MFRSAPENVSCAERALTPSSKRRGSDPGFDSNWVGQGFPPGSLPENAAKSAALRSSSPARALTLGPRRGCSDPMPYALGSDPPRLPPGGRAWGGAMRGGLALVGGRAPYWPPAELRYARLFGVCAPDRGRRVTQSGSGKWRGARAREPPFQPPACRLRRRRGLGFCYSKNIFRSAAETPSWGILAAPASMLASINTQDNIISAKNNKAHFICHN